MLNVVAGPDVADPFSRAAPVARSRPDAERRQARRADVRAAPVLRRSGLGRRLSRRLWTSFAGLGANIVEFDIEPFYAAARLLYEGPWVAERYLTVARADCLCRRNRCIR